MLPRSTLRTATKWTATTIALLCGSLYALWWCLIALSRVLRVGVFSPSINGIAISPTLLHAIFITATLAATPTAIFLWRSDRRSAHRARAGLCPTCGYDRRGLAPAAPCPECGALPSGGS